MQNRKAILLLCLTLAASSLGGTYQNDGLLTDRNVFLLTGVGSLLSGYLTKKAWNELQAAHERYEEKKSEENKASFDAAEQRFQALSKITGGLGATAAIAGYFTWQSRKSREQEGGGDEQELQLTNRLRREQAFHSIAQAPFTEHTAERLRVLAEESGSLPVSTPFMAVRNDNDLLLESMIDQGLVDMEAYRYPLTRSNFQDIYRKAPESTVRTNTSLLGLATTYQRPKVKALLLRKGATMNRPTEQFPSSVDGTLELISPQELERRERELKEKKRKREETEDEA